MRTTVAAHTLARPIGLGRLKAAISPPHLQVSNALGLLRSRLLLTFFLAAGAAQAGLAMCCRGDL